MPTTPTPRILQEFPWVAWTALYIPTLGQIANFMIVALAAAFVVLSVVREAAISAQRVQTVLQALLLE